MSERSFRRPVLIEGDSVISVIDSHNLGDVFHGSREIVKELTPQIVYWRKGEILFPDSQNKVVCATNSALVAVFFAIAPREGLPFGGEPNDNDGLDFWVHPNVKDKFINSHGYVGVIDSQEFDIYNASPPPGYTGHVKGRLPEMRATTPQIPLFNVSVNYNDFMNLLNRNPNNRMRYLAIK